MDPADDPMLPDHTVWAMHIVMDGNKLMAWGIQTPDSPERQQFLVMVSQAASELSEALKEIAAGGDRQAMQDRVKAALKLEEKGFGGVGLGDLPPL